MKHYQTNHNANESYGVVVNAISTDVILSVNAEQRVVLDYHEVAHMIDMLKEAYEQIKPPSDKWIGVDLDGTLAKYHRGDIHRNGVSYIGEPIPRMVNKVKQWLAEGRNVKIFTARVADDDLAMVRAIVAEINNWCEMHIGQVLEVTNVKDRDMEVLYDDRAVQVIPNTGMTPLEQYRND